MTDYHDTRFGRVWHDRRISAAEDAIVLNNIPVSVELHQTYYGTVTYWVHKQIDPHFHPGLIGSGHKHRCIPDGQFIAVGLWLGELISTSPQLFLREIRILLDQQFNYHLSITTLDRYMSKWGFSKKVGSKIGRNKFSLENTQYYQVFLEYFALEPDRTRLFYVDEVAVRSAGMVQRYGWARKGVRVIIVEDTSHAVSFNVTLLTSIRETNTPVLYTVREHSANQYDYTAFILQAMDIGYLSNGVLLFDNARTHTANATFPLIEQAAMSETVNIQLTPLPRYSPETNPCELVFNVVKNHVKQNRSDGNSILPLFHQGMALIDRNIMSKMYAHCLECRFVVDKTVEETELVYE